MNLIESTDYPPILNQITFDPFSFLGPSHLSFTHDKFEYLRSNCKYFSVPQTHIGNYEGKDLNILHINSRSLFSEEKFEEFKVMLFRLKHKWDIICISETWLCKDLEQNRIIDGYTSFFSNRDERIGGGVAIYIEKSKVKEITQLPQTLNCTQSICIECKLNNSVSIIVAEIYRPPNLNQKVFTDELEQFLDSLPVMNKSIFVCGDFNFDLLDMANNSATQDFFNTLASSGFWPLISRATRVHNTSHSLLDNIFCKNLDIIYKSGIITDDTSDHFPIFSVLKLNVPVYKSKTKSMNVFDFRKINELSDHVLECLHNFENISDPEEASQKLIGAFQSGIKKFSISCQRNRKASPIKPWITPAILQGINNRCKLYVLKQKKKQPNKIFLYIAITETLLMKL